MRANIKQKFIISSIVISAFCLSGCGSATSLTSKTSTGSTVLKSMDAGENWEEKIRVDDKKTIAGVNVHSMAIHPGNHDIIYLGTDVNGLFVSKDGAESWQQVAFPNKVYGLVFDPQNPDIMYASGVLNGRAKIYKRIQEEKDWEEIYSEPSNGTVITSLAIDKNNPQILYFGTTNGVILKSTDGGQHWLDLKKAPGPVVGIELDQTDSSHVYFAIFKIGILESKDGGITAEDITKKMDMLKNTNSVYSITADPSLGGVLYAGTGNGIYRRSPDGNWTSLNIIESSRTFPIRAIAINPANSKEIIYSAAKAIYKSSDSGSTWSTFQLDTNKEISVIKYDKTDPAKIYAGLKVNKQ